LRATVRLASLALLVLVGYLATGMLPDRADPIRPTEPAAVKRAAEPGFASPMTDTDSALIISRNVFGPAETPETAPKPSQARPAALVRTALSLRLLGTVAGDAAVARAVIEDTANRVQDLYRIDDVVQGARIVSIERNRVILARNGVREVLNLDLASGASDAGGSSGPPLVKHPTGVSGPGVSVKVLSPSEFEINKRAFLTRVGGIEAILKTAKLRPYVVDGKVSGLRVTGLENVSMMRFVGLANGDVIQAVNGQTLSSQLKAFQVFRKARSQSSLKVNLLRGKEKKKLFFKIR